MCDFVKKKRKKGGGGGLCILRCCQKIKKFQKKNNGMYKLKILSFAFDLFSVKRLSLHIWELVQKKGGKGLEMVEKRLIFYIFLHLILKKLLSLNVKAGDTDMRRKHLLKAT